MLKNVQFTIDTLEFIKDEWRTKHAADSTLHWVSELPEFKELVERGNAAVVVDAIRKGFFIFNTVFLQMFGLEQSDLNLEEKCPSEQAKSQAILNIWEDIEGMVNS